MTTRLQLLADRPNRTVERVLRGEKNSNVIDQAIEEVAAGRTVTMHSRTHRGEWQSAEKGHWLWSGLSSQFDPGRPDAYASLCFTFPLSNFKHDSPVGTESLRSILLRIAEHVPVVYGYANLGRWDLRSGPAGGDRAYAETANRVPVSSFDDYVGSDLSRYRSGVRGAFWLNILNPKHISSLGGIETLKAKASPFSIEELPFSRLMVLTTPSPLATDSADNRDAYARLRTLFSPLFC
jgi:hypothetical protein